MPMYRFVPDDARVNSPERKRDTMRRPANVPYLVDNLWEWKRPAGYPDRRHSAYASPTPDLARASSRKEGRVFKVEIPQSTRCLIGQLELEDSKYHPECRSLPDLIFRLLGQDWLDGSLKSKQAAGRLWMPCLAKAEVEGLFHEEPLSRHRQDVWEAIRYWQDVRTFAPDSPMLPFPKGEVFFEADEWRLVGIDR